MINLDHKQSKLHIWFYYLLTDIWLCTLILLELNIFDKSIKQYKKINPICYLLWESALLWPMQLELKKGQFELTNGEFLMILNIWTIESNIIILTNTILAVHIHLLNSLFLSLIFVFFLPYQFILTTAISVLVFSHLVIMN